MAETLALRRESVDFLRRQLHVTHQVLGLRGGARLGPTKPSAERTIACPDELLERLAEHLRVWGSGEGGLLFPALQSSGPMWPSVYREHFNAAAAAAGASWVTPHTLRHYTASALIANGTPVTTVQHILGHASPTITLGIYSHLVPSEEGRVREILGASLEAIVSAACHGGPSQEAETR